MVAQAGSQPARGVSYDVRPEPMPTTGVQPGAVSKQLWSSEHYNAVASALAGFPIVADGEDDYNEWSWFLEGDDPTAVLGFTMVDIPSSSSFYHHIFLAPPIWSTLDKIATGGIDSVSRADAAEAILTLTHEAYHQRLDSGDESRVNACALRDFGSVLESQFNVPASTEQTVTTPVSTQHRVRLAVWRTVKGKHVRRFVYRLVPQTSYREQTVELANPIHDELVAAAQSFVASQPPPYNSGTCF
jgi:hypothetical protein